MDGSGCRPPPVMCGSVLQVPRTITLGGVGGNAAATGVNGATNVNGVGQRLGCLERRSGKEGGGGAPREHCASHQPPQSPRLTAGRRTALGCSPHHASNEVSHSCSDRPVQSLGLPAVFQLSSVWGQAGPSQLQVAAAAPLPPPAAIPARRAAPALLPMPARQPWWLWS